ncbi:MAG: hypothetical protein RLZZ367_1146 [Bacteroidota bacterium]|jgi:hypothetical protein
MKSQYKIATTNGPVASAMVVVFINRARNNNRNNQLNRNR